MLNDKDRELISIGASLAANCQPCTAFHLRAAPIAGATRAEINQAVKAAQSVSRHAMEEMAEIAAWHVGASLSDKVDEANPLISELVSISAASAINSTPDVDHHIAAAQKLGATRAQILSAIKIANAIKGTADSKTQEVTRRAMGARAEASENCCGGVAGKCSERAVQPGAEERG